MNSCQVATKNYDGGSNEEANNPSSSGVNGGGGRPDDAFSLYSNQEIRMDRLLLRRTSCELIPSDTGSDDIMDTSTTNTDAATSLPRRPPKRRTRLSFEVHPSLVLDPLLLLDGGEMTSAPAMISFNENESTAK